MLRFLNITIILVVVGLYDGEGEIKGKYELSSRRHEGALWNEAIS